MEIWDVYDSSGVKSGRTIVRGETLMPGDYHLVVHIWPVDQMGRYLIQKRSSHLSLLPGVWAATGGSAFSGEDSKTAALRETEEELGWRPDKVTFVDRLIRKDNFADIWIAEVESSIVDKLNLSDEVSRVKWASVGEILQAVQNRKFHDYGEEYFQRIFGGTNDEASRSHA